MLFCTTSQFQQFSDWKEVLNDSLILTIYICLCMDLGSISVLKHNWFNIIVIFSTYMCFNPFKLPYICFNILLELANKFFVFNWFPSTFVSPSNMYIPKVVMVKAMDCEIVVREFVLQSRYYAHFQTNTLGKSMNPLILPAMG